MNSPIVSASMTSEYRLSVSVRLLLGLVLLLWSAPAVAQDLTGPASTASLSTTQTASDSAASSTLPPGHRGSDFGVSIDSESGNGLDSFPEFLSFSILILLLIAIATTFVGGFAAVSIFMDTGCLRVLIAALGWGVAVIAGLVVGVLIGAGFGGLQPFTVIGLFGGGLLYIAAWKWGHERAQQLPKADRLMWKHTLTGGALIGTGAGSVANLARLAGALFKGGGGSFGGGGASGSFASAQAAAAASVKGAATSNMVALGTAGVSRAVPAAGGAVSSEKASAEKTSVKQRIVEGLESFAAPLGAMVHQLQRFRWYHLAAFALIILIFMPVGMGVSAILQNGNLLLGLALVGLCLRSYLHFIATERYGEWRGLGTIMLLPLIAASVWAAHHSSAPYWHLGFVSAGLLIVVFYRSIRRSTSTTEPDSSWSFEGGGASDRW